MVTTSRLAVALALAVPLSQAIAQAPEGAAVTEAAPATTVAADVEGGQVAEAAAAPAATPAQESTAENLGTPEPEGAEKAAAPRNRMIDEIIVTAQKREEALMDVPISVQAFSPGALEARGVSDQMGLMKIVPGLDVGSQAGFATIYLRGVGTDAWLTADPSVAAYVDGVYFSFTPSIVQEFGAVERVEVLKGPQGTLFGRNAVGGAINVITKDPDFMEDSTTIQAGYQNFNTYKTRIYTNQPLTDNLAVNFSAFYNAWDSYLSGSTSAGKPLNREISTGARAKLRWAPLDTLDLKFTVMRTHAQQNGALPVNSDPSVLGKAVGVPANGPYETHVDERLYINTDSTVYSTEIIKNLPWLDVKLIASDQKHTAPYNYDFDASERPIVSFDIPVHYGKIQEAELQLLSNEGTPGADWLTITGGVFFYKNEQGFDPIRITVANLDPRNLDAVGVNLPQELFDGLDSVFGPQGTLGGILTELGIPAPGSAFYTLSNRALIETESWSEYLQLTAKVTDWFSLTLGGRYQSEKRGVKASSTHVQLLGRPGDIKVIDWTKARDGGSIINAGQPLSDTTKGFKPKISLDFRPFENDTLIYVNYQEAVKAHAYNAYAIYLRPAYVKPEETKAYELGLKTTIFEDTTRVSIAAFFYDTKDVQTQFVSLINGGAVSFENAGNAKSKGLDFDIAAELFPSLVQGMALTLNGAYINAHYNSYTSGSGYGENTTIFGTNFDYSGNRQVRSPKYTASVALTKTVPLDVGPLEIGANYYYNSGFYYTASNDPKYDQPKYGLLGAQVALHIDAWNLGVKLFGENLTDEFYTNGVLVTDFGPNFAIAPPRMYGVAVTWEF